MAGLQDVSIRLQEASALLNSLIAEELTSKNDGEINYSKVEDLLAMAKRITTLSDGFRNVMLRYTKSKQTSHDPRKTPYAADYRVSSFAGASSNSKDAFPVYFVEGNRLFKIGKKADDAEGFYKKIVPFEDALVVIDAAYRLSSEKDFSMRDVQGVLTSMKPYKYSIVISALRDLGVLVESGRGRYKRSLSYKNLSRKDWADILKKQEVRRDLLAEA